MHLVTFIRYIIVSCAFARSNYTVKILQMIIYEQITELRHYHLSHQTDLYRRLASSLCPPPHPPATGSPRHSVLQRTHPLLTEGRWLGNGTEQPRGHG